MALLRSKREDTRPASEVLAKAGFPSALVDSLWDGDYIGRDSNDVNAEISKVATTKEMKSAATKAAAILNAATVNFNLRQRKNRPF